MTTTIATKKATVSAPMTDNHKLFVKAYKAEDKAFKKMSIIKEEELNFFLATAKEREREIATASDVKKFAFLLLDEARETRSATYAEATNADHENYMPGIKRLSDYYRNNVLKPQPKKSSAPTPAPEDTNPGNPEVEKLAADSFNLESWLTDVMQVVNARPEAKEALKAALNL